MSLMCPNRLPPLFSSPVLIIDDADADAEADAADSDESIRLPKAMPADDDDDGG